MARNLDLVEQTPRTWPTTTLCRMVLINYKTFCQREIRIRKKAFPLDNEKKIKKIYKKKITHNKIFRPTGDIRIYVLHHRGLTRANWFSRRTRFRGNWVRHNTFLWTCLYDRKCKVFRNHGRNNFANRPTTTPRSILTTRFALRFFVFWSAACPGLIFYPFSMKFSDGFGI